MDNADGEILPFDEGELKEIGVSGSPLKILSSSSTDDTEAKLRMKLLAKQQMKRTHLISDEEEMFTVQPGAQSTKKKGAHSERRKLRDEDDRERREKERANRKPIRWEVEREKESLYLKRTFSSSMRSDRTSPSSSSRHRTTPSKRKSDERKRSDRHMVKKRERESDSHRDETHRHSEHWRHSKSRHSAALESDAPSSYRRSNTSDDVIMPSKAKAPTSSTLLAPKAVTTNSVTKTTTSPISITTTTKTTTTIVVASIESTTHLINVTTHRTPSVSPTLETQQSAELLSDVSGVNSPREKSLSPIAEVNNSPSLSSISEKMTPENDSSKNGEISEPIYKKSKFESSPELDEGDFSDFDLLDAEEQMDLDPLDDADMDDSLNFSDLERKQFEDLTDEDKARLSPDVLQRMEDAYQKRLIAQLPVYYAGIEGCRHVREFECVNRIEEGTFGVVFRAVEKRTDEVVALKRLKMENETNGFPITSLREINMLLKCGSHLNIVNLREIVVGDNMDKIYLVMEYVDHDMKALMETMSKKGKTFTIGQVKTLLRQLLCGVEHLHKEYVIHRDLKTSNLLLTRDGILKIGDFGLAREFGDPIKPYTPVVVTLWYRSPELLLGVGRYSTAVDMWSVGCIFAEFLQFKPLFPGRGEMDQLNKIFTEVGTPNEKIWPGYNELPGVKKFAFVDTPYNQLRTKFGKKLVTEAGFELLNRLLAPCPERRTDASKALKNEWFIQEPLPVDPSLFPTWPSKSDALCKDKLKVPEPPPPIRIPGINAAQLKLMEDLQVDVKHVTSDGFSLKFDVAKF